MFPPPETVLRADSGTLDAVSFPLLLSALLRAERSCVLELTMMQLEKQIHFEDGVPVACFSNLVHETLGYVLMEKGKLSEAQHLAVHSESVTSGASVADLVVRKQLVAPYELYKLMQGSLGRQLLDCFRWERAHYRFVQAVHGADSPIRMSPLRLIFTGCTSFLPFETVTAQLAFDEGDRFALAADADVGELKLAPKDLRFVNTLRASPTFDELAERGGCDVEQALRRLYALGIMGFAVRQPRATAAPPLGARAAEAIPLGSAPALVPGEEHLQKSGAGGLPAASPHRPPTAAPVHGAAGPAASTRPPRAAAPAQGAAGPAAHGGGASPESGARASPPPGQEEAPHGELDGDPDALMAEFLSHRNKDPFDVIGVAPEALPAAMRKAFLAKAERFAPVRFRNPELKERAEALLVAFAKAFGEISIPEQLVLLRKRRSAAAARDASGPARPSAESQFRIKTTLLDASAQFSEGLKRLQAEQWRQAVSYFEYAFNIEAKAKHRAFLAWARYRLNPAAHAKLALTELGEAQRVDPSCADAFGFAGDIHRTLGDVEKAEAAYRAAQRVDPSERRYAQALRDLPKRR